jgi:hypothetical protein
MAIARQLDSFDSVSNYITSDILNRECFLGEEGGKLISFVSLALICDVCGSCEGETYI